jgi:malate dehydrogenase (oxaloacetate-decarboxylating)(NADP+)
VDEFVAAVQARYPDALIQFEDFLTPNAYALLARYRQRVLCFNDDIQGTAAVVLAGVLASARLTGRTLPDARILFLGAGSAATGIADLMVASLVEEGLDQAQARRRLWFVDKDGLVVKGRTGLMPHNLPYAHDHEPLPFVEAIDALRPNVLIGATGVPGTFTRKVVERMSALNERPAIFALSNPTSRAECTAEQAYTWSRGRASSRAAVRSARCVRRPRLPARAGQQRLRVPRSRAGCRGLPRPADHRPMFLAAARTLAGLVGKDDLERGSLYPPLQDIRRISLAIATSVAEEAWAAGVARRRRPASVRTLIKAFMYVP